MRLFPIIQFFDNNGDPLDSGKIYTYVTNTSTPTATYTTVGGETTQGNPIVLDSFGRPSGGSVMVWLSPNTIYRLVLKDKNDVTIKTIDGVTGIIDPLSGAYQSSNIKFATGGGIYDDSDNEQLLFTKTASAVNYLNITNAATTNGPTLGAAGDDTNIDMKLLPKGSGKLILNDAAVGDSSGNSFFTFTKIASAVNNVNISNAATANAPTIAAVGSDTNIDLKLSGKGSGKVNIPSGGLSITAGGLTTDTATISGSLIRTINGAFYAYGSTGTSVATSSTTQVTFNTELFDVNNWFSGSGYTPQKAGYYLINAGGGFSTCNAACSVRISIAKNGTAVSTSVVRTSAADQLAVPSVSTIVAMNGSSDYITVTLFQDGGGTETSTSGSDSLYINGFLLVATA